MLIDHLVQVPIPPNADFCRQVAGSGLGSATVQGLHAKPADFEQKRVPFPA